MARDELSNFYDSVVCLTQFPQVIDTSAYELLPSGWIVGVADIVNSTTAISAGRYKAVNMVGAGVIAGVLNAIDRQSFPFVFGGDGAAFALPGSMHDTVARALASLQVWAREEIGLELRAAIVPVDVIRANGHEISVTRLQMARDVSYSMFSGGGVSWAEEQMKAGRFHVAAACSGDYPDLTGLSCRWSPIRSRHGRILSLLVVKRAGAKTQAFEDLVRQVLDVIAQDDERQGHPIPRAGPEFSLRASGIDLEARTMARGGPYLARIIKLRLFHFLIWGLFKSGLRVGGFDPATYRLDTTAHTDYRKMDDGLKLTIDCSQKVIGKIEALLADAHRLGLVNYGMHVQDEALMTCFVPSPSTRDHMHFVDGAGGGYAKAAIEMKARAAHANSIKS